MSKRKFILDENNLGATKEEILKSLANELGYGVYPLKTEGITKKELTVIFYEDQTVIIDINKHQMAYKGHNGSFNIGISNGLLDTDINYKNGFLSNICTISVSVEASVVEIKL